MRPLAILAQQTLRVARPVAALPLACPACASRPVVPSFAYQVRYASKKKTSKAKMKKSSQKASQQEDDDEIEVEDHPVPVIAKGKKGKAAQVTEADAIEAFQLDKLEANKDNSVDRQPREMRNLVGRVEKLSPGWAHHLTCIFERLCAMPAALLDSIRVEEHGERHPLQSYATVSVSGPDALTVNIFDVAVGSFAE